MQHINNEGHEHNSEEIAEEYATDFWNSGVSERTYNARITTLKMVFKVLLKELQALGLDVRVLGEDGEEVQIMENIDYGESEYRFDLDDDRKYNDYDANSLGAMGYQTKEFSEDGEFVDAEPEGDFAYEDDYTEDSYDDIDE